MLIKVKILSAAKVLISETSLWRFKNLMRIVPNHLLKATLGVFTVIWIKIIKETVKKQLLLIFYSLQEPLNIIF